MPSLGFNPYILSPMCDILFDEKIAGSFHFTPGQAYEDGMRFAWHVMIREKHGSVNFIVELDGTRVLSEATVDSFIAPRSVGGPQRTLGFDVWTSQTPIRPTL